MKKKQSQKKPSQPTLPEIADTYRQYFQLKMEEFLHTGPKLSEQKEREAQKYAIKEAAKYYFAELPEEDKGYIWNGVYAAHVARKAGVLITPEVANKVISADQSWKKSSGHAFEELVKELANASLSDTGIEVILQRDLKKLWDGRRIQNDERDMAWLLPQIQGSVFDLFLIKEQKVFGCIQSKTSIRDRVTRDREPSTYAMANFFWSVAFVLEGDFLKLPKFQSMVNGGSIEFPHNGWHGLYAFSLPEGSENGRIHLLDAKLSIFKKHAIAAANDWFGQKRQWFDGSWEPR
jgi:hypothetical protein